ncbi:putative uncharacterized protein [Megasphaera elsdenii CAG:570]|uniref:SLH domain-containing protein n=1 Tax=Megasphaera elsdenii CAG:570 TaxID=1263087 RepID=R7MX68_MEGEL|nr:putative uncharacterized protein [Megasphaera elsdenii CAG:570]
MNKVFKVIWSEARNAYVVVSEMAKSHGTKSCSTKKLLAMLIATGVMTCASMAPAMAANPAPDDKNIAIGSGASTNTYNYNNVYGDKPITGDIAIGQKAYAWNGGYNEGQDIYIGTHEYYMDFGQGGIVLDHSTWRKDYYKVVDGSKVAGSIAIGKNSVARTGSTILGDHTYNGKIGDTEITSKTNYMNIQPAVFSTTIGSNTYNAGTLATVTGAFSIASSKFDGSGNTNTVYYGAQNTGATIYGSMNSIESATSNDWATLRDSGIASSVLGFANRTQNANAALIWGTGNEITNSIEAVTGVDFKKWNSMSVSDAQKDAIKAMQSNQYAGGSVMAIGGGNKADYTTYSELTGVQNKVTGTKAKAAKYDLVNGYQNTVSNASDVTVIGIKNEVTADGNKVIGDNHRVSGKDNVIFGSADQLTETTVNNAVVLGHNAKVTGEGGVALGAGSVADRANAVSVGSTGANRQIINVAAGTEDTDAVNVSQLKDVELIANKGWNLTTAHGKTTTVKPGDTVDFSPEDTNLTVTNEVTNEGTNVKIGLNKYLHLTSATFGDTIINANGLTIGHGTAGLEFSQNRVSVGGQQIHDVADGKDNTDAVNVRQLKQVADAATSNDKRLVQNPNDSDGSYQVKENGDVTLRVEDSNKNGYNVTIKDVASKAELDRVKTDVGNVDGFHDEIKNKDTNGKPTHTSVVDAVNNLDTKVNTIQSDVTKATEEAKKHSSVSTGNGLDLDVTDNNGQKDYKVSLKDDFTLGGKDGHTGSIEFKGSEGNITASGTLTANAVSVGNTSISDTGLQIGNKTSLTEDALTIGGNTYITDKGIDANQQKISNVADGDISKDSKDAVNGSQLYATNEAIANNYNNITNLNGRISNLDNRVNKVGAGAAALAALHPLDFDPDAKWDFAAGYGNYRGANAAAVGAYYRPNEDTMFSVGGTFGNGENMVNAGVSFKLGSGSSHVSTSRVAMAKEIKELRGELEAMKSAMLDANAGKKIDTSKLQLFPDVPQNHWAYEYVAQLAGNGMIEGYPDGNFAGDRPMTRYEFAAILYRAMTKGAVLSDKILSEFSHELEYFTVDTIAKDKAGNPTIQRVRTVKENKNK